MESDLLDVSEAIARARARGAPVADLLARRNRLILEARAAGMSNQAIAALADVSRWMVIKVRRQHGPVGMTSCPCPCHQVVQPGLIPCPTCGR